MKKYLALLLLFVACSSIYAALLPQPGSNPIVGSTVSNTDKIILTFTQTVRAVAATPVKTLSLNGGPVLAYSGNNGFWSDISCTIASTIVSVNPLNKKELIIDLTTVPITPASFTLNFQSGFVVSILTPANISPIINNLYYGASPILSSFYPANLATDVLPNDTVKLVYSGNVDIGNDPFLFFSIPLVDDSPFWSTTSEDTGLNFQIISNNVTILNMPVSFLPNNTYKVIVDDGFFVDVIVGNPILGVIDGDWTFSVNEITAIAPFVPANAATAASVTSDYSITFSDNIVANSGYVYIKEYADSAIVDQINVLSCSISGSTLTIPHVALNGGSDYFIELSKGIVKSSTTNYKFRGISGSTTWKFKTENANIWTGAGSNDFLDGGNWSNGNYDNTQPTIIGVGTNPAKLSTAVAATDLTITSAGLLEIASTGSLTLSGKLTMESTSTSNSSLIVNGSISVSPSNVFIYQFAGNTGGTLKKGYSSPVSGATGTSAGTTQTILKFDNPTAKYVTVPAATTWDAAVGYATYASSPLVFKGALNTAATYSMPLIYTSDPGGGAIYSSPYNFYGNPYTAPLDWVKMWKALSPADTMLVRQTCWVLKESGSWKTINGKWGTVTGGAGTAIPRGHAFMLRAKPPVGGGDASNTIVFKKADLVGGTQTFLKSLSNEVVPVNIRLTGISNDFQSDILYGFHPEAQFYYENSDSEYQSFPTTSASFDNRLQIATYTSAGSLLPLAINTVPEFVDSTSFNVAYFVKNEGGYCIELTELDAVFKTPNTLVTLRDTVENLLVTMAEGDRYYFYTTTTPSVVKNRFKITIKSDGNVPTSNPTPPTIKKSTASVSYSNSKIHINLANDELSYVDVYSTNGELVLHQVVSGSKAEVPFEGSGIYIVKVVGQSSSSAIKIIAN